MKNKTAQRGSLAAVITGICAILCWYFWPQENDPPAGLISIEAIQVEAVKVEDDGVAIEVTTDK